MARTFEQFVEAVKDSCENHARRKNYTTEEINGKNQLAQFCTALGINEAHSVGECIYKLTELLKAPQAIKHILIEKVAGWCWIMWRDLPDK